MSAVDRVPFGYGLPELDMKVYLDTSAYNRLWDMLATRAAVRKSLRRHDIWFSSCNLDEFALAERSRGQQLAQFAWEISNRRKLMDHIELMMAEVLEHLGKGPTVVPFDNSPGFFLAWDALRKGTFPVNLLPPLQQRIESAKRWFQQNAKDLRQAFHPIAQEAKKCGLHLMWHQTLQEMEQENRPAEFLINHLLIYESFARKITEEELKEVDYRKLRATSLGIQYYFALHYRHAYTEGPSSRPDRGDQVDVRHVFYAALVDYYVTADDGMADTLTNMVTADHGKVISPEEFLVQSGISL